MIRIKGKYAPLIRCQMASCSHNPRHLMWRRRTFLQKILIVLLSFNVGFIIYIAFSTKYLSTTSKSDLAVLQYVNKERRNILQVQLPEEISKQKNVIITPKTQQTKDFVKSKTEESKFIVQTSSCSIPDFDPHDHKYARLLHGWKVSCDSQETENKIFYTKGEVIYVNHTYAMSVLFRVITHCSIRGIVRDSSSDGFHLTPPKNFTHSIAPKLDFVRVRCFSGKFEIKPHQHIIPLIQKYVPAKSPKVNKIYGKRPPNVLLVCIDSVSRLNFMRQLPKTRSYLQELEAVEFGGYNKIGDNTFPNMVAMLSGKYYNELPWNPRTQEVFDKYWWIWDAYKDRGYQTLFAEDSHYAGMFNWAKKGFLKPPTHHYARPMFLAMNAEKNGVHNNGLCYGSKLLSEIVCDYTKDFALAYKDTPYFALSVASRLTHDYVGQASAADDVYEHFLKGLVNDGLMDNTVLFMFSDHGMRFGAYRKTAPGKYEERLPFLFVLLPKYIKQEFPLMLSALKRNSKMLTTPFDVHESLKDLVMFPENLNRKTSRSSSRQRGISLFSNIPENRTCEDADIEPHYCTCSEMVDIDKGSKAKALVAGEKAVAGLNKRLESFERHCEILKLERIDKASQMITKSDGKSVNAGIRITFSTMPGHGLFEATVLENGELSGSVSRINKYGDTSWCVQGDDELKKICYCKVQRFPM